MTSALIQKKQNDFDIKFIRNLYRIGLFINVRD